MATSPAELAALPIWQAALVIAPAALSLLAAVTTSSTGAASPSWKIARATSSASLALAAAALLALFITQPAIGFGLRTDLLGGLVMLLVTFVGWVIVRYSQPYLTGEAHELHYVRWLMATLAAVSLVIATNHLLVLALAWIATSFALHRLLTFFNERPAAVVAAHKKFIVARLADVAMLAAVGLFAIAHGSFRIDQLVAHASSGTALPLMSQAAVCLVAIAALLKCAQLPFHGWLIQVMEAPTPVSALLHAGIVNLGGFVLMRLAPLVTEVTAAQVLLVVVGTLTAVLAALVMTTRISIKVQLAWSTCAQMGFMLMQCGLGAWDMALLHLLAHSLYKAHAFLGAGGAVRRATLRQLTPATAQPTGGSLAIGALAGVGMTLAAGALWTALSAAIVTHSGPPAAIWVLAGIVALSLVPLLQGQALRLGGWWLPSLLVGAFAVALGYFALHTVFATWVMAPIGTAAPALWIFVAVAFGLLFLLQAIVWVAPRGTWSKRLYPWFYGGLFLDEAFTRIAFGLWHPPAPTASAQPLPPSESVLHPSTPDTTAATGARA